MLEFLEISFLFVLVDVFFFLLNSGLFCWVLDVDVFIFNFLWEGNIIGGDLRIGGDFRVNLRLFCFNVVINCLEFFEFFIFLVFFIILCLYLFLIFFFLIFFVFSNVFIVIEFFLFFFFLLGIFIFDFDFWYKVFTLFVDRGKVCVLVSLFDEVLLYCIVFLL